jgi:N-acyl amino acid synthase FeeM
MPHSSIARGRSSDSATKRPRHGGGNRITAVLAALEREIIAEREFFLFGSRNQFSMEVATSLTSRRDAAALLPAPCERGVHDLLPSSLTLLVRAGERPLGTATLFVDGPMGLPLDDACRRMLDPLRCSGRRLVQIGDLALREELHPLAVRAVVMNLIKVGLICARRIDGATDIVAGAFARHRRFTTRFSMLPITEAWSGVLPVRVALEESELAFLGRYAGLPGHRDLDLFLRREEDWITDWLKERRRPLAEPALLELLSDRRKAFAALSVETRHGFEDAYLAYDLSAALSTD